MEPNKLENSFRDQLNKREIQPSEMSWDRLDAMLSVAENKKPKKRTWMYIAASFLGFILIGSLFFNQSETGDGKIKETVVTIEKPTIIEKEVIKPIEIIKPIKTETVLAHQQKKQSSSIKNDQVNNQILNQAIKNQVAVQDAKAEEVAQKIMEIQQSGREISEKELDDLLRNAKKEIAAKRIFNKSSQKVDAMALLQDAESNLDNTFKQKVFELLKDGYKETKTFIVERNN